MSIRVIHDWINTILSSPRFYYFVCCCKRGSTPIVSMDSRFRGNDSEVNISRKIVLRSVALICLLLLISCGDKGEFAFKGFGMDTYRTMKNGMEFPSDARTDWLYKFPAIRGKRHYGVIMLKKELMWAEIAKEVQEAQAERPCLYGVIQGLEPGEYKIMITQNNKLVDENEFIVFDPRLPEKDDD